MVVTGDKLNAGTDSKVYVTIYGKTGATKKILLKSTKNRKPFQQGDSDLFKIHDNCVGPLTKVKVEHDNTGFCPGWFLERVSRQTVLRQSCLWREKKLKRLFIYKDHSLKILHF